MVAWLTGSEARLPREELVAKYTTDASRFVDVDGARVHYRDEGAGPTLLLLHGTYSSLQTWDGWVEELSDDFRCVRMDLPGFGLTGPWSTDHSVESYEGFVDSFVATLDIESFALGGHSLGGAVAWRYALDAERVSALVLAAPFGYPSRRHPVPVVLGRTPLLRRLLPMATPRWFVAYSVRSAYGDRRAVTDATVDRYHELLMREGNRSAAVEVVGNLRPERYDELVDVEEPTLVLWGSADAWIHPDNAYRFERDIPDCRVVVYDGVGHVPMEEIPERTSRAVRAFLERF